MSQTTQISSIISADWPCVPLGTVISHRKEFTYINDLETYKRCRVQVDAKGILLRDIVEGLEVKTKKQQVCRSGEFLVAEIDAKAGGYGIVPEELEGAIVSSHYFLYEIDTSFLNRRFLDFYIRTPTFREQVAPQGSTNYAAIRPKHVLEYQVPLPPLHEQRRIVGRIEALVEKVEEARGLRAIALHDMAALLKSALKQTFEQQQDKRGWKLQPLNCATDIARGKFSHRPRNAPQFYGGEIPYIQIGDISASDIYINQHSQTLNAQGLAISRLFPAGTIVIAITGATIGATGILGFDSCFPDSIVGIIKKEELAISEYIYWSLEYVKQNALDSATQTTQPNINLKHLNSLSIPVPSLSEQERVVSYLNSIQAKIDNLKQLQAQTETELNALIPAILDKAFKGEL